MEKDPDLNENDDFYLKNYVPLTQEYLTKVAHHANLDDVINGLVSLVDGTYITNYSGNLSRVVNPNLKNNTIHKTHFLKDYEEKLFTALKRLPSFNSENVYRMELDSASISEYHEYFKNKIGKVMMVPYYLSTSKDIWEDEKIIYSIKTLSKNSNAKDISRITNNKDESEVLIIKDTNFLILDMEIKNEVLFVYLEETLDQFLFIYNYVEIGLDESFLSSEEKLGLFD